MQVDFLVSTHTGVLVAQQVEPATGGFEALGATYRLVLPCRTIAYISRIVGSALSPTSCASK